MTLLQLAGKSLRAEPSKNFEAALRLRYRDPELKLVVIDANGAKSLESAEALLYFFEERIKTRKESFSRVQE